MQIIRAKLRSSLKLKFKNVFFSRSKKHLIRNKKKLKNIYSLSFSTKIKSVSFFLKKINFRYFCTKSSSLIYDDYLRLELVNVFFFGFRNNYLQDNVCFFKIFNLCSLFF